MKGYITLFALAAALLLLIPLPALPHTAQSTPSSSHSPEADSNPDNLPAGAATATTTVAATTTAATTTTAPAAADDTFRLLVGDEVVTLTERDFLIRTLAFEMPPAYHAEALKAQAVAAYTYYGRRRAAQQAETDPALKGAHFATPDATFPGNYTETALKSRWGTNYTVYYNKLAAAVDAVLGHTITYDGQLIDACYFAMSNGATQSAETVWGSEVPYLHSVASPGDCLSPDYQTTLTLPTDKVKAALLAACPTLVLPTDEGAWFGKPTVDATGHVATQPVGNTSLTGPAVRAALGLRSATFTVAYTKGNFTFTVKGYGHGVGMSQYGADYLARQGYTYEEIIKYYYEGVTIT